MSRWTASIRAKYESVVTVEAETEEEAREKIRNWDFIELDNNELIDFSDPEDLDEET